VDQGWHATQRAAWEALRKAEADMMIGALLTLGAALVAVTAVQAAPVSVGELLSDPDRLRDRPVTIIGTMSRFREHVTHTRTRYYTFDFGDGTHRRRMTSEAGVRHSTRPGMEHSPTRAMGTGWERAASEALKRTEA
jgi:hypothetical protein